MGFLDQLRMNDIYGTGGNMFTTPQTIGTNPYEEIIKDFLRLRGSQQEPRQTIIQQPPKDVTPKKKKLDVTQPPETPTLKFGGVVRDPWEMNDYQRASIRLRERELGVRDENADRTFNLNQAKFSETQNQNDQRNKQAEERITDQKKRTEIADFRRMNPGLKELPVKGGNVILYNPVTGATMDTGISSGEYTDDQKTDAALNLEGVRQTNREKLVGVRGDETRKTNDAKDTSKPLLPTQQRVEHAIRAKQIVDTNPEWAKYIQMGENNDFTVTPPGKTFFGGTTGPTPDVYKKITDTIYGSQTPASKPKVESPASITPAPVAKPNTPSVPHVKDTPNERRVIGQTYMRNNGKPGIWTGVGFREPQ